MAGYVKGSLGWMQRMIGMFHNEARKIHENSPENDESLKKMIRAFGDVTDQCLVSEPVRPLREVMTEKIFGKN